MISIIITAYKEQKTIGRAISSILEQNIPEKYELIVTAPDKETLSEAGKFSKKSRRITIIQDKGIGKPEALNLVIRRAKGRILILTDGDVFCKNISELLKPFNDEKVGAVTGNLVSLNSSNRMIGYWSHFLFDIANLMRERTSRHNQFLFCSGYLFAVRKELIEKIPPNVLDDAYISQIIWAKGYKIKHEKTALAFVKSPSNFKDWVKQKKRNVYGEFQLSKLKKGSMRGIREEFANAFYYLPLVLKYSIKEICWIFLLFLARLYVWLSAFIDIKFRKKDMKKMWTRIESTK